MAANQNQPVPTWKTVVTVLSLLFFFPLGVLFMFLWMKWPLWVKILLSAGIAVLFLIIIPILSAIVVVAINPLELTRRARDAARLSDVANVQQAVNIAVENATDPNALCYKTQAPCEGRSSSTDPDVKNIDGSGWVKVDLSKTKILSTGLLPIDPVNSTELYYRYCSDGKNWEIEVPMESQQDKTKYASQDKGDNPNLYEAGSDLTVCK